MSISGDAITHRDYIRRETAVSIAINAVMSALIFWLVFYGVDPIPTWGMGNWVFDFAPQSFMIGLMSNLVPGTLAAKAIRDSKIARHGSVGPMPANLVVRAVIIAVAAALLGTAAVAVAVFASGTEAVPAVAAFALKIAYGATLALLITPIGLRWTLASSSGRLRQ